VGRAQEAEAPDVLLAVLVLVLPEPDEPLSEALEVEEPLDEPLEDRLSVR